MLLFRSRGHWMTLAFLSRQVHLMRLALRGRGMDVSITSKSKCAHQYVEGISPTYFRFRGMTILQEGRKYCRLGSLQLEGFRYRPPSPVPC
jgi:hypothetical protein